MEVRALRLHPAFSAKGRATDDEETAARYQDTETEKERERRKEGETVNQPIAAARVNAFLLLCNSSQLEPTSSNGSVQPEYCGRPEPFREIFRYCYSNEGRASKKYRPILSRCPFAARGKRMHIDHSSIR